SRNGSRARPSKRLPAGLRGLEERVTRTGAARARGDGEEIAPQLEDGRLPLLFLLRLFREVLRLHEVLPRLVLRIRDRHAPWTASIRPCDARCLRNSRSSMRHLSGSTSYDSTSLSASSRTRTGSRSRRQMRSPVPCSV